MKKSFSLLLAFALVFSMFSSLAFADNGLTEQQKFEALKAAGIMAGVDEQGTPGLDQKLTRAQAARIVALLLGVEGIGNPDTRVVTEPPFNDVPLNHWAVEEIDAIKDLDIIVGYGDGNFGPSDNLTIQQLAVIIAKVLGLEPVEGAEVEGADNWAAPYIKALQDNGIDFPTNYKEDALRADLVNVTYTAAVALGKIEAPASEQSVSGQQTGARKITVKFAVPVSKTDDVKFTVKRGNANVALDDEEGVTWSADKKSAVLKTASKLVDADYTVTVADQDGELGKVEFRGQDEKIESVEILAANDYIANYEYNIIKIRGVNQFGEDSETPASQYTVIVGHNDVDAYPATDKPQVRLAVDPAANVARDSRVPFTVIAPNHTAQATKTFIVGDAPQAAKVEFGELKLEDGEERLTAGKKATLELTVYDQYGNEIPSDAKTVIENTTTPLSNRSDVVQSLTIDNDANLEIQTKAGIQNDVDVTVTVVANGSGQSFNYVLRVYAERQPADLNFGEFDEVLAENDGSKYIPLEVYDQFGEKMSPKDVANAAANNRFNAYSTNSSVIDNVRVVDTPGNEQGKVHINVKGKGSASIIVTINGTNKQAQMTLSVQDERVPNAIVVEEAPAPKMLPNATYEAKYKVVDQYGADWKGNHSDYKAVVELSNATVVTASVTGDINNEGSLTDGSPRQTITLTASGSNTGKTKLTVKLVKVENAGTPQQREITISSIARDIEVIGADKARELTYEVKQLGTLYAVGLTTPTPTAGETKNAKEVTVEAKDSAGNKVALPSVTMSVYTSNDDVAEPVGTRVYGKDKGSATITAHFTLAGIAGFEKVAVQTVTVDDVLPYADSLTAEKSSVADTTGNIDGAFVWDVVGKIVFKDQYGIEYENAELFNSNYQPFHKVKFTFTTTDGSGKVTIDNDGKLQLPLSGSYSTVKAFTITITSLTNGKSVEVQVQVTDAN
jgi:hypothetical protein